MCINKISISVKIFSRQPYITLFFLVVINFAILAGTFLCNSIEWSRQNFLVSFILRETNLAWENTSATWYSSMLLLIVAMLATLCFISDRQYKTKQADKLLNYGWIIISLIFTLLSLDEIGSIHESIGRLSLFNKIGIYEALLSNTFYLVIGVIALFMVLFGWFKFKNNKWAMLLGLAGIALFITNPLNERFEWSQVPDNVDLDLYKRNPYFIVLEEGTEIFGSLFFMACLLKYLVVNHKTYSALKSSPCILNFDLRRKNIFYGAIAIISFLLLLNIVIQYEFYDIEKMDNGIAENWFPSAASFVTCCLSMYLYHINKSTSTIIKSALL